MRRLFAASLGAFAAGNDYSANALPLEGTESESVFGIFVAVLRHLIFAHGLATNVVRFMIETSMLQKISGPKGCGFWRVERPLLLVEAV